MNTIKENTSSLLSILRGEFIADQNNQKYIPLLLFIVLLILGAMKLMVTERLSGSTVIET